MGRGLAVSSHVRAQYIDGSSGAVVYLERINAMCAQNRE